MHSVTWIFYHDSDLSSLSDSIDPQSIHFLALTPSVYLAAKNAGFIGVSENTLLSDTDHLRCAVKGKQVIEKLDIIITNSNIQNDIAVNIKQKIWFFAITAHRLSRILRSPPYFVCDQAGKWHKNLDSNQALSMILSRIAPDMAEVNCIHENWFLNFFARLSLQLSKWRKKTSSSVLSPQGKLKLGIQAYLVKNNIRHFGLTPVQSSQSALMLCYQFLFGHGRLFPTFSISKYNQDYREIVSIIDNLAKHLGCKELHRNWENLTPVLKNDIAVQLGYATMAKRFLNKVNLNAVTAYEANGLLSSSLFMAARQKNLQSIIFNHNFHPFSDSAAANHIIGFLYKQRKATADVSQTISWFPGDLVWSKIEKTLNKVELVHQPVRLSYPVSNTYIDNRPRPFRILYAGNYQNWDQFFPLVAETSCEFVESLKTFIEQVSTCTDIDLTIRVRPKTEVNKELIEKIAADYPNVTISGVEQPFTEQLAQSDLLVSFFSTAIGEAVQLGKPVLLWGHTNRYLQLPSTLEPPSSHKRHIIYHVEQSSQLPTMVDAIKTYHKAPLSEDEYKQYVFLKDVPTLEDCIKNI